MALEPALYGRVMAPDHDGPPSDFNSFTVIENDALASAWAELKILATSPKERNAEQAWIRVCLEWFE